jgi:hypothetical protein
MNFLEIETFDLDDFLMLRFLRRLVNYLQYFEKTIRLFGKSKLIF